MTTEKVPISAKYALTVFEAMEYFGIGRDTLYRLIKNPTAPYVLRVGRTTLIKRVAFETYLNGVTEIAVAS